MLLKLLTSDGHEIDAPTHLAQHSVLLRNMLEDVDVPSDAVEVVSAPCVSAETLGRVLDLTRQLEACGKVLPADLPSEREPLFALTAAADYLQIDALRDAGVLAIARLIPGQSPAQLQAMFGLA